jgi:hypothetical protein
MMAGSPVLWMNHTIIVSVNAYCNGPVHPTSRQILIEGNNLDLLTSAKYGFVFGDSMIFLAIHERGLERQVLENTPEL